MAVLVYVKIQKIVIQCYLYLYYFTETLICLLLEGQCQTNHHNQLVSDHIILVYTFYHLISYQFPVRSTSLVNIIKLIHHNNWWTSIPPWWLHINNYQYLDHLYLNCIQHFCINNWSSYNNYNSHSNIFWVCFRWQNWSMHKQSNLYNDQRPGYKIVKSKIVCQYCFSHAISFLKLCCSA